MGNRHRLNSVRSQIHISRHTHSTATNAQTFPSFPTWLAQWRGVRGWVEAQSGGVYFTAADPLFPKSRKCVLLCLLLFLQHRTFLSMRPIKKSPKIESEFWCWAAAAPNPPIPPHPIHQPIPPGEELSNAAEQTTNSTSNNN